jgi:hypothetical protein
MDAVNKAPLRELAADLADSGVDGTRSADPVALHIIGRYKVHDDRRAGRGWQVDGQSDGPMGERAGRQTGGRTDGRTGGRTDV